MAKNSRKTKPNQPELNDGQREHASIKASLLATRDAGIRPRVIIDRSTGIILDGELVKEIADEAGVEVETVYVDVADPEVVRLRLKHARRHPSEIARAIEVVQRLGEPVADAARLRHGCRRKNVVPLQRFGRACEILAEIACCSPATINNAVALLKPQSDALMQRVLSGSIAIKPAVKLARRHRDEPEALDAVLAAASQRRACRKPLPAPVGVAALIPAWFAESVRDILDDKVREINRNPRFQDKSFEADGVRFLRGGFWNDRYGRAGLGFTGEDVQCVRRSLKQIGLAVSSDAAENLLGEYVYHGTASIRIEIGEPVELVIRNEDAA